MTNEIDGGAAFHQSGYEQCAPEGGMTLRDYFAAKAMQASRSRSYGYASWSDLAEDSYDIADAMLEARNK